MSPHLAAHRLRAAPAPLRIALLGAARSGKTQLAAELMAALNRSPVETTPLLIADDPPLATVLPTAASAKAGACGFDQVLLMGLDLSAGGKAPGQEAADQQLRQALSQAGVSYTVIYGLGPARLANALGALHGLTPCRQPQPLPATGIQARSPWVWACDTCSDPQCERRLLSDLLARR